MRNLILSAALAALAVPAYATQPATLGGFAKSLSVSGFISTGQPGSWSVGAMNSSNAGVRAFDDRKTVEINTWGGSTSEGFGERFRGSTAAAGFGSGFGGFGRR